MCVKLGIYCCSLQVARLRAAARVTLIVKWNKHTYICYICIHVFFLRLQLHMQRPNWFLLSLKEIGTCCTYTCNYCNCSYYTHTLTHLNKTLREVTRFIMIVKCQLATLLHSPFGCTHTRNYNTYKHKHAESSLKVWHAIWRHFSSCRTTRRAN